MRLIVALALAIGLLTAAPTAHADETPAATGSDTAAAARDAEVTAALKDVRSAAIKGPADIAMLSQATLKLPAGYAFVPPKEANRLMRAWGNSAGGANFIGMIFPTGSDENWFITANFADAGYVKDTEAKNWDIDALLKNSRDNVEADNEDRVARGFPKIKVDGWIEKPLYDETTHRLVYSIALSDFDAKPGDESSVNYHTFALGREGYLALDLVTGSTVVDRYKDRARTVLAAIEYKPGKGYNDYVASTDRVAEYGIAALIGGIAAKKLGLLALGGLAIAKFGGALVAFAKPLLAAVVAVFAGVARLFRRRPKA